MTWSMILAYLVRFKFGNWDEVLDMSYEQIDLAFQAHLDTEPETPGKKRKPKPGRVTIETDEDLQKYLSNPPC